ncbi:hypothetical protein D3C72_1612320 [compost metagenome]
MDHLLRRHALHLHAFGRAQPAPEGQRQRRRQQPGGQCRRGGNAQGAAVAARQRRGTFANLLHAGQGLLDLVIEQEALLGRADTRAAARKQRKAQLGFQLLDQPRDRRLRTAEQPPRGGNAAGGHDRGEGFQLPDFHEASVDVCVIRILTASPCKLQILFRDKGMRRL